jgi:hypothetical protein
MKIKNELGEIFSLDNKSGMFVETDGSRELSKDAVNKLLYDGRIELIDNEDETLNMWESFGLSKIDQEKIETAFAKAVEENTIKLEEKYTSKLDEIVNKLEEGKVSIDLPLDSSAFDSEKDMINHFKKMKITVKASSDGEYSLTGEKSVLIKYLTTDYDDSLTKDDIADMFPSLAESLISDIESEYEDKVEKIEETLNTYLGDLYKEWKTDNAVALQNEEIIESAKNVLSKLTEALIDNNIDLPESKGNMYDQVKEENIQLKEEMSSLLEEKHKALKETEQVKCSAIIADHSADLTYSDELKFVELCAEISEYSDLDDFENKVELIKNQYFSELEEPVEYTRPNKSSSKISDDISAFVTAMNK